MILKIILTLVILIITFVTIKFVWTKDIDFREWIVSKIPNIPIKKEIPNLEYGITSLPVHYNVDQKIDNITWRLNYTTHLMTIVNSSGDNLYNLIVSINFPGAIVEKKVESSVNVYNITFSSFNKPIELRDNNNTLTKIENVISNYTDISIEKMNKHSTLTISFILDYRNKPKGYWQYDLSYEYPKKENEQIRNRIINPIKIISETPLIIQVDKSIDFVGKDSIKATQDMYPFSPLISKPNGKFIQVSNFKGDINGIKIEDGDAILFSTGIDYTVNTNMNYK